MLSRTLRLSSSKAEYIYLRTARELSEAIDEFETSRCRYLHFSCHGNKNGISLTFDHLTFAQLAEKLDGALENKRVFFSSCSVMNDVCARALLLPETGCLSLIGPSHDIDIDRAAVFWAAFYHLMLRDDARAMKRAVGADNSLSHCPVRRANALLHCNRVCPAGMPVCPSASGHNACLR